MRVISLVTATAMLALFSQSASTQQFHPLIEAEMESHNLFGMEGREVMPGITVRNIAMATIRMNRIDITEGSSTPNHNHPDEEIVMLLEGSVIGYMGDKEYRLDEPGETITIPAYVQHRYLALEDSVTIELFGPGRAPRMPTGMAPVGMAP